MIENMDMIFVYTNKKKGQTTSRCLRGIGMAVSDELWLPLAKNRTSSNLKFTRIESILLILK